MFPPIKIKIALQHTPIPINRTVLVQAGINMRQLHLVIQDAMGWYNAHLFQFSDKKIKPELIASEPYSIEEFSDVFGSKAIECNELTLEEFFIHTGGKPIWYEYDFGDSWLHKITLLKTFKKDIEGFDLTPVCIKANGACPMEDIGGPWGYANFIDAMANPKHPKHKEMVAWSGLNPKNFDSKKIDLSIINSSLKMTFDYEGWLDVDFYGGLF